MFNVQSMGVEKTIRFSSCIGSLIYKISHFSIQVRNQTGAEKIIKIIDITHYKRAKQITYTVK